MDEPRLIFINGSEFNLLQGYADNYISSTKYNLISFLPKCLFQQFRRVANLYFLAVAVLQSIPIVSPLQPFSAIAPFVFVIAVSMIREGVEDYRRYRSDKETNSLPTLRYENGFKEVPSYKLAVGDIVMVKKDQVLPCDLVFLSSSEETGLGFIETSSLDGEKNLKPRQAFAETSSLFKDTGKIRIFSLVEVEPPNAKLYQFHAMIHFNDKKHSLDRNSLLLAGSFLKNTQWAIGAAVYTGTDTKLRMNLMSRTYKQSTIEGKVNKYIIFVILLQLSMCTIPAVLGAFSTKLWKKHEYFETEYSSATNGFLLFFTYFLLLNTMLPISLIVSLEIAKVFQAYFMEHSLDMYSEIRDQPCKVFSSSLNEELGMVKHVFTDKTGTLTCNKMRFRFCTIGSRLYGYSLNKLETDYLTPNHLEDDLYGPSILEFTPFRMSVGKLILEVKDHKQLADQFLKCMSLCHECIVDKDNGKYIGPSPDEITLLDTAKNLGYIYQQSINKKTQLKIVPYGAKVLQICEDFEKICTLEFTSDRKRNSVIFRDKGTGFVIMYCKGADNVINARLSKDNPIGNIEKISADLLTFSKKGYRTLLLAFRIISETEFLAWKVKYDEAARAIYDREERMSDLSEEIEKELILLGCTAVEDSLQEQVPDTIKDLLKAGIKVWMLTGDKLETAVNIGKTCGLVGENAYIATCKSKNPFEKLLKIEENAKNQKEIVLVIEGQSLELVLSDHASLNLFLQISEQCKTVICCRVSPGQKQKVVKVVKNKYKHISLSIGDGANDVSMILEANIGIGLYGEEGMQAVQASDFAIGEFRFLWDLILNQGRINYIRQSEMILYFFYKNMVFTLPQFYFAFFCFYSGQTVYDDWYITCYNMVFTALPLMVKVVLDRDIVINKKDKEFKRYKGFLAETYVIGRENLLFTARNFAGWVGIGFVHSAAVFFVPIYVLGKGVLSENGESSDFWGFSIVSFTCIIIVVNLKLAISIRYWTIWHFLSIFLLSIGLFFAFALVYDKLPVPSGGSFSTTSTSPPAIVTVFCTISLICSLDIAITVFQKVFQPSISDMLHKKISKKPSKISPIN